MPVDLDELFDAMRRRADTVPLRGAAHARARGRHRDRVRAVMTVAVVVAVVAVGTGFAVRGPAVRHDQPAMPAVGSPLLLDGVPTDARIVTDGDRAYVAWTRPDNDSVWVAATDLRTGAVAWAPQRLSQPDASEALAEVLLTPSAVVVVTKPRVDPPNGFMFYLLDRATGALDDAVAGDNSPEGGSDQGKEDWVFAGDQMVTMQPSGQIFFSGVAGEGYNGYTSGDPLYARLLGWGTTADEKTVSQSGPSAAFTDSRVVLVTVDGTADVFDARRGKKLRTVRLGLVSGKQMAVFDGVLSMVDPHDSPTGPQRLRFVDVSGGNGGAWETAPIPGAVVAMSGCGPGRVCAVTSVAGRKDQITAFDVRQRRVAWQATTEVTGAAQLSVANGRALVAGTGGFDLYDPDGRRTVTGSTAFHGVWLDPQQLLVERPEGVLARLPIGDREPTPIGRVPAGTRSCASTSTRLVCLAATTVTTWEVR
ncbi:hypothetical protein [Actinoplanes sp. NPDC051411]|uniref:hypothetical protein n=1 Tax=Actinoplanes sp. NPDC051411 TaxID=3155522 RepID=UPI00342689FD